MLAAVAVIPLQIVGRGGGGGLFPQVQLTGSFTKNKHQQQ